MITIENNFIDGRKLCTKNNLTDKEDGGEAFHLAVLASASTPDVKVVSRMSLIIIVYRGNNFGASKYTMSKIIYYLIDL